MSSPRANLEALTDVGPEALQVQVDLGEVAGQLTKKQLVVLSTAVEAGYYDSPRRTSTVRLAASFVSRARRSRSICGKRRRRCCAA